MRRALHLLFALALITAPLHAQDERGVPFSGTLVITHKTPATATGTRAWTGNIGSNSISELDLVKGTALPNVTVPAQPEVINVTPDEREVWVGSNATGVLSVVDAVSGKVSTAAEGFGWPYRVLFSPDNALVVVSAHMVAP